MALIIEGRQGFDAMRSHKIRDQQQENGQPNLT
jgi:hypothetical protein